MSSGKQPPSQLHGSETLAAMPVSATERVKPPPAAGVAAGHWTGGGGVEWSVDAAALATSTGW